MARELLWSAGPELNDLDSWFFSGGTTGWSIATSPAPTHGTYIFKGVSGSSQGMSIGPGASFTPKNYVWLCLRGFRLTGTLGSGDQVRFLSFGTDAGPRRLEWDYTTASTFKIKLMKGASTVILTSTNAFSTDAWPEIRLEFDGTNATLWVNGMQEDEGAETAQPDGLDIALNKLTLSTGQEHYYRGILLTQSDSESDRPGTAVENDRLDPDGSTAEDDGGGVPDDVSHPGGNKHQNWDDYAAGGAPDDDTTYLLFDFEAERKHVSTFTTHTPTDTIEGIIYHLWARGADVEKIIASFARIKEGANASEVELANFDTTDYEIRVAVFNLAPDDGAWTQGDVDALEVGLRQPTGNDVNLRASALAVELVSVDDDPPPVTGFPRSFGAVIG